MQDESTFGVCLYVSSNTLSVEELNTIIGIKADEYQEKGENKRVAGKTLPQRYESSLWIYDSRFHISKHRYIDEHIEYIAEVLEKLSVRSKEYISSSQPVIGLRAYTYSANPGACIKPKFLRIFSGINATIDIDFFSVESQ
ncbi:DUF4279 domain-containing protein [Candidatus Saccharibacteria bacterium]|nr:MAG: DUF4279 domain-containing protein [Candidatus Saccharibacteria bacterium]